MSLDSVLAFIMVKCGCGGNLGRNLLQKMCPNMMAVEEAWSLFGVDNLGEESFSVLIDTMPRHCQAELDASGGHIIMLLK